MNVKDLVSLHLRDTPLSKDIVLHQEGHIDFSFGNPSAETFPIKEILLATKSHINIKSLQYCPDRGSENLLISLSEWLYKYQNSLAKIENLIITNGSMDGIATIADAFIDPGEIIFAESPTYWKARDIFQNSGAQVIYIPMDKDGLRIDILKKRISESIHSGKKCKLLYVIPNYQNPTGYVTSLEKRKEILAVCEKYNILIIEDDVYSHLTYQGNLPQSIYSLSDGNSVIQVGSLSKLVSPGIRIGWILGSEAACTFMLKVKRDGGTNPLASEIASFLLSNLDWEERIKYLNNFYYSRLESLYENIRNIPSNLISWEKPKGGFYFWVKIADHISLEQLEKNCNLLRVGFMPGYLCTNDDRIGHDHIRLAFSDIEPEKIRIGVNRINDALLSIK